MSDSSTPVVGQQSQAAHAEQKNTQSKPAKKGWGLKPLMVLGGMVLGALVGMAVQMAVSTTGVLGPGMEELIGEQTTGFQKLEAKIEAMRGTSDPAQIKTMTAELNTMLADQKALAERTYEELRGARAEIERLKEQSLESSGTAGGANLWLKPGESVTVGPPTSPAAGIVVSFVNFAGRSAGTRTSHVDLNIAGESKRLGVGDSVQVNVGGAGEETFKLIYKQTTARADGRVGFDVVKE